MVDTGHHQLTVDDQVWHARYAFLEGSVRQISMSEVRTAEALQAP